MESRPARPVFCDRPGMKAWLISCLFWMSLGLSAILMGALVLTPRWLDVERQHRRYARNEQELRTLEQEVIHLTLVAQALQADPDYLERITTSELHTLPAGQERILLKDSQEYDSRVPIPRKVAPKSGPGVLSILEVIATSGSARNRLAFAASILILITFLCFNENFLSGGQRAISRFLRTRLKRRYATDFDPLQTRSPSRQPSRHLANSSPLCEPVWEIPRSVPFSDIGNRCENGRVS